MYALTIHYNDRGPFVATASEHAAPYASLRTTADGGLSLRVEVGRPGDAGRKYELDRIGPGDTLRFRFDMLDEAVPESIEELPRAARAEAPPRLQPEHRFGLVVARERFEGFRLSDPEGGGLWLGLGTIPRDHARVFVRSGNRRESWHWQLPDLYSGDSIGFEVIETTWSSPFPDVQLVATPKDRILLNQLAQSVVPIDQGVEWFEASPELAQRGILSVLTDYIHSAGALASDADAAIERSCLRADDAQAVLLAGSRVLPMQIARIRRLPSDENARSFRLLLALFAIADERRRATRCAAGCSHWWHRDLADPAVVAAIERAP